jgi:AcrR family transcriptional regulator
MVRTVMTPSTLDRERWEQAALDALERGGLAAVAVEPLARELGVTKGSFYWHFANRRELIAGALRRWQEVHVDGVLADLEAIEDPAERLRALFGRGQSKAPSIFIRLLDATDEPLVREAVARAAEVRVAFMARAFRELGLSSARARRQALVVYGVYVGLAHLGRDAPEVLGDRRALNRHLMETLLP